MASDGKFAVAWSQIDESGLTAVKAAIYQANGVLHRQFSLPKDTAAKAYAPSLAANHAGTFAIAWLEERSGYASVLMSVFSPDATPLSPALTHVHVGNLNTTATEQGSRPSIALWDDNASIVVWDSVKRSEPNALNVLGSKFRPDGSVVFQAKIMTNQTTGDQRNPAVGIFAGGSFVVTWTDDSDGNNHYQIQARRFDPFGNPAPEQTVNKNSGGDQRRPTVASDSAGRFAIAWEDDMNENGIWEILARGCYYGDGAEECKDQYAADPRPVAGNELTYVPASVPAVRLFEEAIPAGGEVYHNKSAFADDGGWANCTAP